MDSSYYVSVDYKSIADYESDIYSKALRTH